MKTERRHELQTNDLANWIGQMVERLRPYSMTILGVAIAVLVLGILWSVWSSRSKQAEQEAWARFELLTSRVNQEERVDAAEQELRRKYKDDKFNIRANPEEMRRVRDAIRADLEKFAEENADLLVGSFAAMEVADEALFRGVELLFDHQTDAARTHLDTAAKFYQQVVDRAADPMLLARARIGLARSLEARRASSGDSADVKAAQEAYEQLKGVDYYSETAQRRLAALKGESPSGDFYRWFDEHLKQGQRGDSPFGPGFNLDGRGGQDSVFDPSQSGPRAPGERDASEAPRDSIDSPSP